MKLQGIAILSVIGCVIFTACTKIERTTLGGDLIPIVDNVYTFDTTLKVVANNYLPEDSTRLSQSAQHPAGGITNDPQFGTSLSTLFYELKPLTFPFKFADSVKILDSAVMVLKFSGYYGDSTSPIQFNLFEVNRKMQNDTSIIPIYTLDPPLDVNYSKFWGTKTIQARQYRDTVFIRRGDSVYRRVTNELRIPLNYGLALALFRGDSANVFGSNEIYKNYLPGFALEASGSPMALHYFNIAQGSGSEIQFYYRQKNNTKEDTLVTAFGTTSLCGHAVKFKRNRSGAEINNFQANNPSDGVEQIYVDAAPGAMAKIIIPDLKGLSNRVLHRVELKVTELEPSTGIYSQITSPPGLYLDAEYPDNPGNYRGLPYDLNPFSNYYCYPNTGIEFGYFGGLARKINVDGNLHTQYTFNITRYVQSIITRNESNFNLRLSAPYTMYYKECVNGFSVFPPQVFPFLYNNSFLVDVGEGRIRLGGGNHPNPKLKMQFRIIYSKL